MNTHRSLTLIFIVALTLVACTSPAAGPTSEPTAIAPTTLTIAGSGSAATVLKYLAGKYGEQHSEITFEFLSGSSSGGGVKGVLDNTLDLGTMSRPPKDSELASGIQYLVISTDRIVIVTSADLSISSLTSQQVKDIFMGTITNWSEVGGPNASINVLVRDEDESSTQVLRQELFGDGTFAPGAVVFTSDGDLRDALSKVSNTIAFLGYSGIRLSDLKLHTLLIDGHDPAALNSNYPYARPMGIAYLPSNADKVQTFLDFLGSPEAQALLAEKGINAP